MRRDDHHATMVRIPRDTYMRVVESKKQTKSRSINQMVIDLLVKALEDTQKQEVVTGE